LQEIERVRWIFKLKPKDGGSEIEEVVRAVDMFEAVVRIENDFGLEDFEKFEIRRLKQ
jgi:hypothetical protein